MSILAGIDIGGTKCAVCLATVQENEVKILGKHRFLTRPTPDQTLDEIMAALVRFSLHVQPESIESIGISCGGPLDSQRGLILNPPNLPGWDVIDVFTPFRDHFQVPVSLQNDANACALAEWSWGAGQGCRNMIFLTFGTGMGAGLILNGQLYTGTNDLAGEVGHIRLEPDGPSGYGKPGSFEGFCSGSGIARFAQTKAKEQIRVGSPASFCPTLADLPNVTAESVARAAQAGDPLALAIYQEAGRQLGRGLAILVDILNPERIIIGSIFTRQEQLLAPYTLKTLSEEALALSLSVCSIVPSMLGERVGDLASVSVARLALRSS